MSQFRLAIEAGVDHTLISRYESETRHPLRDTVDRLCDGLRLSRVDAAKLHIAAGYVPSGPMRRVVLQAVEEAGQP